MFENLDRVPVFLTWLCNFAISEWEYSQIYIDTQILDYLLLSALVWDLTVDLLLDFANYSLAFLAVKNRRRSTLLSTEHKPAFRSL